MGVCFPSKVFSMNRTDNMLHKIGTRTCQSQMQFKKTNLSLSHCAGSVNLRCNGQSENESNLQQSEDTKGHIRNNPSTKIFLTPPASMLCVTNFRHVNRLRRYLDAIRGQEFGTPQTRTSVESIQWQNLCSGNVAL